MGPAENQQAAQNLRYLSQNVRNAAGIVSKQNNLHISVPEILAEL